MEGMPFLPGVSLQNINWFLKLLILHGAMPPHWEKSVNLLLPIGGVAWKEKGKKFTYSLGKSGRSKPERMLWW